MNWYFVPNANLAYLFHTYGGLGSTVARVAAATAQKNEGHTWIVQVENLHVILKTCMLSWQLVYYPDTCMVSLLLFIWNDFNQSGKFSFFTFLLLYSLCLFVPQ